MKFYQIHSRCETSTKDILLWKNSKFNLSYDCFNRSTIDEEEVYIHSYLFISLKMLRGKIYGCKEYQQNENIIKIYKMVTMIQQTKSILYSTTRKKERPTRDSARKESHKQKSEEAEMTFYEI